MKKLLITTMLLTILTSFASEKVINQFTDTDMIRKAGEPIFAKKGVIITLPPEIGYQVFIRTDLDGWKKNYYFSRSFYGIYYCLLPYDYNKKSIKYRLNINGFWSENPLDSKKVSDHYGNDFSVINYPEEITYLREHPIINNNTVIFRTYAPEASTVNFVYSGTRYSKFAHSMNKKSDGYWELELVANEGDYAYYFLIDGKKHIDMNNQNLIDDAILGSLSTFVVGK